ncbi:MAG TPA: endonuclease/exonuclease/phosphatase family protein [Limnochordia bacterium]|nr:endonuclease/exonuclease/phosphatase family protein [Limnochordia bacterium]
MRVMSFNLRMDTPSDQEHAWPHRIPAARFVLEKFSPDVLGIQEGLPHMVEEVASWSDQYAAFGRGRLADGTGEAVTIFYRKDRLEPLESGHFWLSDTPDVPGSATFGNTIPRMATWIRLRENEGREWLLINTHLDHASEPARQKGAQMLADFVARTQAGSLVVVTGDFNATPDSVAVKIMLEAGLVDAVAAAGDSGPTFHGYKGEGGSRIDYIFCDARLKVEGGQVFRERVNGLFPSDHYPIWVDLG